MIKCNGYIKYAVPSETGGEMLKLKLICAIIAIAMVLLPGCTSPEGKDTQEPATGDIPVETEFGRMLGFVPCSILEEDDVWFINFGKAKQIYGVEDVKTIEEFKDLPDERRKALSDAMTETGGLFPPTWRNQEELSSIIGFDGLTPDRIISIGVVPPRNFSILEGDFDEELIAGKLTGLGYSRTDYGAYSYYGIREDFKIDLTKPLGQIVMASMNRLAVFDDTIIASPATGYVTGIFDAMAGDTPSVIDNTAGRALADSLGDVLTAVVTIPARIVQIIPPEHIVGDVRFDFDIPGDWGTLHEYDMAALGYRAEGGKRFLEIALYYDDAGSAEADGTEIVKRMEGYILGTFLENMENIPFTEKYLPGEPEVHKYADGAVLTVACELIPEDRLGTSFHMGGAGGGIRDMLFLAPDPSVYVK
jgi:hypothetical protein